MVYADLNIPWPSAHLAHLLATETAEPSKKAKPDKGKAKAAADEPRPKVGVDIWQGMPEEDRRSLRARTECAIRLGYSVIAFNLLIPQSVDPSSLAPYFPFPLTAPPFPELDPRTCSVDESLKGGKVLQLSRLTVVLDSKVVGGGKGVFGFTTGQSKYLERFNILAAQPLDAGSFGHACLSLSAPVPHGVDIVSLDLSSSPRFPFFLPLHTVSKAVEERLAFEILYSPMTSSSPLSRTAPSASTFPCVDPSFSEISAVSSSSSGNPGRRNVVAGGKEVIRVTKGKGVIVSSGAARWSEMRAPDDVANLAQLFGLSSDQARKAVSANALTTVKRGEMTRQTYRGIISNPVLVTRPLAGNEKRARSDDGEDEHAKGEWARVGSPLVKAGPGERAKKRRK